jgi:hypothetical protein
MMEQIVVVIVMAIVFVLLFKPKKRERGCGFPEVRKREKKR